MGKSEREKGKRGERDWAHFLTDRGYPAKRGQQHKGGPDSPDTDCPSLPIHWEVKRVEALHLKAALGQSREECGAGKWPAVASKRNRESWVVHMDADDFVELVTYLLEATNERHKNTA